MDWTSLTGSFRCHAKRARPIRELAVAQFLFIGREQSPDFGEHHAGGRCRPV
jgi:hypothetical protein